ncbi:hypothetical protein, partial [Vibrio parahaemolyticus]
DSAFTLKPKLDNYLQQGMKDSVPYEMSISMLKNVLSVG